MVMPKFDINNRNNIIFVLDQYHCIPIGNLPYFILWESFKVFIKNNIDMVKERSETTTLHFPEGELVQEDALLPPNDDLFISKLVSFLIFMI